MTSESDEDRRFDHKERIRDVVNRLVTCGDISGTAEPKLVNKEARMETYRR